MGDYWDERWETLELEEMEKFQLLSLKEQVKWAYEKIPFYKHSFDAKGVKPADLESLEDIKNFPFTLKTDLRYNYPFGFCSVSMDEVARIHVSSGTTGKPIISFYTKEDIDQWTECMARGLWAQGIRPNDIVQNTYSMGLFTGGLGFHQGSERIGCAVIPASAGITERQIMLMEDFGATVLFSTPTYALTIAERAEKLGKDIRKFPLKIGCFGAEPWTVSMRKEIEQRMGIKAHEHYGLTELMGPGVSFSCEDYKLHINEDHIYPEIIDPVTEKPLPLGSQGELVLTALQRKAMPLIRYRTRDITTLRREECSCGRRLIMMDKVLGRSDDMLIVKGVNIFPSQIEDIIMSFSDMIEPHYLIHLKRKGYMDIITVDCEAKIDLFNAGKEKIKELEKSISNRLFETIGIDIPIRIVEPESIIRSEGKAKRVIDER